MFISHHNILIEQDISKFTGSARCLLGSWFLTGVLISQCYRGDNISHLTAPIGKPKLEYYSQLLKANFSFLSPISFQSRLKEEKDLLNLIEVLAPVLNSIMPRKVENIFSDVFESEFETTCVKSVSSGH